MSSGRMSIWFTIFMIGVLAACGRRGRNLSALVTPTSASPIVLSAGASVDSIETIQVDGQVRTYRQHIPPGYSANTLTPLVLNFHGYSSNATQQEQVSRMSVKADAAGFISVYPEGLGDPQAWHIGPGENWQADLAFVRQLVTTLESQWSIDPTRIYATGISNGAQMANRLGCEMADTLAAIAPVSGGYFAREACAPTRPVPVVAFHGTADKLLPYTGDLPLLLPVRDWAANWATHNGCNSAPTTTFQQGEVTGETWGDCQAGADVTLYTIEGKGHSWPGSDMPALITTKDINATDVIWDFFLAHPKP